MKMKTKFQKIIELMNFGKGKNGVICKNCFYYITITNYCQKLLNAGFLPKIYHLGEIVEDEFISKNFDVCDYWENS
jgi:hypothetical protein